MADNEAVVAAVVVSDPPAAVVTPPPPPAAAAEPPAQVVPQGLLDRIDRLTRDKKELEERLRAAPAAAAVAPAAPAVVMPSPAPVFDAAEIDRRANDIANQRLFTSKCNTIAEAGGRAHQDFPQVVQTLGAMGVLSPSLINAADEIGQPSELLYALGKDLNEAARIGALAPEQQAIALMRFSQKQAEVAGKKVSGAPPPPDVTVNGGAAPSPEEPLAEDDADTWFRKREKQTGRTSGVYG